MNCQRCHSERIAKVDAKCPDAETTVGPKRRGGIDRDTGIGGFGGEYINFRWCLDCGQIQGEWPRPLAEFEMPDEPEPKEACTNCDGEGTVDPDGSGAERILCPVCSD